MTEPIYRIALVGSSGYIAKHIIKALDTSGAKCEILNIDMVDDADVYLNLNKPDDFDYTALNNVDYIIFTAAISGPDKCATDFDMCWNINVIGTCCFIKRALQMAKKVLFFSSDAVYGDEAGSSIYNESSPTNAVTAYGKMKKAVEDAFKEDANFKCIRLSYVVSANDKFISYCCNCIKNGQIAEIYHPFYRNCTTVTDVITAILWLIRNWNGFESFVLCIPGIELVSRLRMADELNRLYNGKLKYTICSPGEGFYANRPPITQMESLYLYDRGIVPMLSFTEKLKKEINHLQ